MMGTKTSSGVAMFCVRMALATSFLSAVADRFGIWGQAGSGEVTWGSFSEFVAYTGMLLWFLPDPVILFCAWAATILEVLLAIGLIVGRGAMRPAAIGSGLLLLSFALCMTFATGPEGPFSYSVWTAAAAAFLLATHADSRSSNSVGSPMLSGDS